MTIYEWLRVLLAAAQFVATLGAPFVIVWFDRKIRPKTRRASVVKRGKRNVKRKK